MLGDTSTGFKTRVLGWINDICRDIASKHNWPQLYFFGSKYIQNTNEEQSLLIAEPSAPAATASAGGSLTASTTYSVAVTFYQGASKTQSRKSTPVNVSTDVSNKTISLTNIPVSSDPLATARKIYLSKAGGKFYLYSTINDNVTTTASITADTTSTFTPPDFDYIREVIGNPNIQNTRQLEYRPYDQLKLLFAQNFSISTPSYWASRGEDRLVMYPRANIGTVVNFSYQKVPNEVFADADSEIELPITLKIVLKQGVKWLGSEYRDRDDQFIQAQKYESALGDAFSKFGNKARIPLRVRSTQGTSDGYEVS